MSRNVQFRIRYWGTTGTIATPLTPAAVQDKVVDSILGLLRLGRLRELPDDADRQSVLRLVESSLPLESRSTVGGNTTCIEVQTPDARFIVDTGSGARQLGRWLSGDASALRAAAGADSHAAPAAESRSAREGESEPEHGAGSPPVSGAGELSDADPASETHVLLTHSHMDHTFAMPFFDPYYDARNRFHLWGSRETLDSLRAVLDLGAPLGQVYFPISFEMMRGIQSLHTVGAGETWSIGQTRISTLALTHPGGCLGYRLQRGGRSIVIASDHELTEVPDPVLSEFAAGADLLYADAQYLQAEYEGRQGIGGERGFSRVGWGHGTVEGVVSTGVAAHVRRLHLGHHEPTRDDRQLMDLERYARQLAAERLTAQGRPPSDCELELAREGLVVEI